MSHVAVLSDPSGCQLRVDTNTWKPITTEECARRQTANQQKTGNVTNAGAAPEID
jgi:hypothetical protein